MKDQAMHMGHSSKARGWLGLGLLLGLLLLASFTFAQSSIHKNAFETKLGWNKGGFDAPYEEIAHRIDDRDPHNGRGSEYIELNAMSGNYIHYVYPVGKAPVTEELQAGLWVRANRPGIQMLARVVLPNQRDPKNLDSCMTTYIRGDTYQAAGQWKLLSISRPVSMVKQQQQLMIAQLKENIDFTGAYIDALVLNLYAGPGSTQVWMDDLEVGPVTQDSPFQTAIRPDNNTPGKTTSIPRPNDRGSVVEFNGNRLMVGNKRLFFRAVRYTDTMLGVLHNAGFNTICFDSSVKPSMITEASDLGMWVVPELRVLKDDGSLMESDEIAKQVTLYSDNDAVMFRRLSGMLSFEQAGMVARGMQVARVADPSRAIAADVWDGLMPYSRTVNLVGIHRWPLMTTMELPKYREWLETRKRLANPGAFTWTWIQTHLPDWYAELLYNQSPLAEFKEPVGPQPEQVRLLAYTALSAGCRGLGYWSDRFLADSHHGRDRLLSCALVNQEMEMLEPMLVTVEEAPQWIETSVPQVKAAVLRCAQGVLVIPIWQGPFSQFVPGQASVARLSMVVPQVPMTTQAWEVTPAEVHGLKVERVEKGLNVTLPEFGLTSMVVFTSDTNLVGRFQDQARVRRQNAAQWSYDMARYELEKLVTVQTQLEQVAPAIPDAHLLIEDSKKRLRKSEELWKARNFSESYLEAQRAMRPMRILMRAQWEKAVRGLDSPVSSPYAVSFYTLPKHWALMDQVGKTTAGPNLLVGGDFEIVKERVQEAWEATRKSLDEDVVLNAERVTELAAKREEIKDAPVVSKDFKRNAKEPRDEKDTKNTKNNLGREQTVPAEGQQCAMLQIQPKTGKLSPPALERTLVALTSPGVKLAPGTLVQISGWVNIPSTITSSPDGALIYDSAGGEPLAIRLTAPTPWKKYTVYRRVPASGTINVTLALTGIGTVYFDDIRIETLAPPNAVASETRASKR